MKKSKSKILNLLLAASLGVGVSAAAVGGTLVAMNATAAETYKPTNLFATVSSASVDKDETDKTKMAFTLNNGSSVQYRRDLALKWYSGEGVAEYLSYSFEVKEFNFETLTFTFESAAATSTKDKKAVNKIVFKTDGDNVVVKVGAKAEEDETTGITYNKSSLQGRLQIALTETGSRVKEEGEYFVTMKVGEGNAVEIGSFTNVGSFYADYASSSSTTPITPFAFTAKMPNGATSSKSVVYFYEMNKQSFALNDSGEITDNAKPVLVVNEEVSSFALGTPFSLDYAVIDVLDSSVNKKMEYYQYNPNDTEADYKELKTTTYFYDSAYDSDDDGKADSSVYVKEGNKEFVSVRFKLEDDSHSGDDNAATYYLTWYASAVTSPTNTSGATATLESGYIEANRNSEAPKYSVLFDDAAKEAYQTKVTEAAKDVNAGSDSSVYLPSLRDIITDNDTGYTSLKFNIYYRTQASDSTTPSTNIAYDKLSITTATAGKYEFKVAAVDKAGNTMKAIVDGKEVEVGSDNVWDIDEIPSFEFSVSNNGLKIEEESDYDREDSGTIDEPKSVPEFEVNSVDNSYGKDYYLYIFDMDLFASKYPDLSLVADDLSNVTYKSLNDGFSYADVKDGDYETYFLTRYANALVARFEGVSADDLISEDENGRAIIRKIGEEQSEVSEKVYPDNKYEWNPTDRSFMPDSESLFLVLGVFTDSLLPGEAVAAYKLVDVTATVDTIRGDTQWLKNNIASVVLFSIAAVMLILIIILLLVKPSDETLEDVDKEAKVVKVKKKDK